MKAFTGVQCAIFKISLFDFILLKITLKKYHLHLWAPIPTLHLFLQVLIKNSRTMSSLSTRKWLSANSPV
jgi:hypothetical protein